MFIVYCVCQTESIHWPGGSGLTKGTAGNKDLSSQKLHSEERPDVSGEWSSEIYSSWPGISLTRWSSNCHPVVGRKFPSSLKLTDHRSDPVWVKCVYQ